MHPVKKMPKILLVEDEAIIGRDIALQIQSLGYECAGIANNAQQALELVERTAPQLVLMDIQLGGPVDGISVAATISERFKLPVVFSTAFSSEEVMQRAKLTEPFGYIVKPFSDRELSTALAIALYRHEAETRLRDSTKQLKALSRRVLEVQEVERRRVAIELHDELGQSLTAIKINLQLCQRLQGSARTEINLENLRIVEDALKQVRVLATTLRPSMLDDLGLGPALQWLAEQAANRSGFTATFNPLCTQPRLAADIETACFRIVQEALTNIARHASAKNVEIRLERDAQHLVLYVNDDGCGFNPDEMRERATTGESLGVLGMQERATLIGGQLNFDSQPGRGCAVVLRCPWRDHKESR